MHKRTSIVVSIASILFLGLAVLAPAGAQDSYAPTMNPGAEGTTSTGGIILGTAPPAGNINTNPPSSGGGNFGGLSSSFTSLADLKNASGSNLPKVGEAGGGAVGDPAFAAVDGVAGGTSAPSLAITGSTAAPLVLGALGLLAAGFVLTGLADRRRAVIS